VRIQHELEPQVCVHLGLGRRVRLVKHRVAIQRSRAGAGPSSAGATTPAGSSATGPTSIRRSRWPSAVS